MKYLFCVTFLLCAILVNAQDVVGTYQFESGSDDSNEYKLKRTLQLHPDGRFTYYNYRYIDKSSPKETHTYGRGTWIKEGKVIIFNSDDSDLDTKFTLNFSGTKARFIYKSLRDKSDRIIKTSIQFYETEIGILKGLKLIKQ